MLIYEEDEMEWEL